MGETPWIQVSLSAQRRVREIDLAHGGPNGTEYEVGFTCEERANRGVEADSFTLSLDEPEERSDALLTLPEDERTREAARAAFDAADDGPLVFQHALWLARSTDPSDHVLVGEALKSRDVVELLGNTTIDRGPRLRFEPLGHRWPLAQILFALRDGDSASGRALLTELASDPLWSDETLDVADGHVEWLLRALAAVRPPPPAVLAYFRSHAGPGVYAGVVASALVENGSDEAVSLLRTLLRDGRIPAPERAAWLRADIGAARHRPEVLQVAEQLLLRGLPPRLDRRLLEDLFGDFTEELRPDSQLSCPALERVPEEAALILRRIGAHALARRLGASTRHVVEEGLQRLLSTSESADD